MMKRLVQALLCGLMGTAAALSQLSMTAGTTAMADDNISNSYERGSDRVTLFSVKPSYDWNTDATSTQLWYDGSFAFYSSFADRSFQLHSVGLTHVRTFGDEDAGTLEAGAEYAARRNRDSFTLFDHSTFGLAAAAEYYVTETFAVAARYAFHSLSFSQLGDFDYREHAISVKQSLQLQPTTTIIFHNEVGIKNYSQPLSTDTALFTQAGIVSGKIQRTVQLNSSLRLGQALGGKTGLSLSAGYRYNFQQSARYLSTEYGTLSEDELFNDHYGYGGFRGGVLFTQLLPSDVTLRLRFDREERTYALRGAYDLSGLLTDAERHDTYSVYSAVIERQWTHFPLTLMLSYEYISNASNDAYYKYTNNVFSIGLTVPF